MIDLIALLILMDRPDTTPEPVIISKTGTAQNFQPLDSVEIAGAGRAKIQVLDGEGKVYHSGSEPTFNVAGALGKHTVVISGRNGQVKKMYFDVRATTAISDESGEFSDLLASCKTTMGLGDSSLLAGGTPSSWAASPTNPGAQNSRGGAFYDGKRFPLFVPWVLDHVNVAKGAQFFSPNTWGLIELFARAQRPDGMVWSFVRREEKGYYWDAYEPYGYAKVEKGALFARQPVENHNEYMFVNGFYIAWKSSGDDAWAKQWLDSAMKALDYSVTDKARWSTKYELLKRGYTVDSWDFLIDDGHTVQFPLASAQLIDPDRTQFGVFFGDNHGYALACEELAEMLNHFGRSEDAQKYTDRAKKIRQRLDEVAWNGKFYRHWVPENLEIKRDLGVDESSQLAMSNAYALNRGVSQEKAKQILETYQALKANLPNKSPGEWYAIYPPYQQGLGDDNERWQYMNGGVHGHAAGELARGAFSHGFEEYGVDILRRMHELGRKNRGKMMFAYTGAVEPQKAPQIFTPVSLQGQINMNLRSDGDKPWMKSAPGNDLSNLPSGTPTLAEVPYDISGAVAVSSQEGYSESVDIAVNQSGGAVYLLHTFAKGTADVAQNIVGSIQMHYEDGTTANTFILNGTHVAGWWYPNLALPDAGVAWRGPNKRTTDVGVSWCAIPNPKPQLKITKLTISAVPNPSPIYAVIGVTLADRMPFHEPSLLSTGGPDNWTGGTVTAALIEGLVGVKDTKGAMATVELSPRWSAAGVKAITSITAYGSGKGYIAYRYTALDSGIELRVTGDGDKSKLRVLLPKGRQTIKSLMVNGKSTKWTSEKVEQSVYVVTELSLTGEQVIKLEW